MPAAPEPAPRRGGAVIVLGLLVLAAALYGGWVLSQEEPREPAAAENPFDAKQGGTLLDVACVERSGRAMRTSDLKGRYVLADFIFTSCSGQCPKLGAELKKLQDKGDADVQIVSFTVDPERDTPERLADYARRLGADETRWLFLRCEPADLRRIMADELGLVEPKDPTLHSELFVLFDTSGHATGTYEPLLNPDWRADLAMHVRKLRKRDG